MQAALHVLYQKVTVWQSNMADHAAEDQMTKACIQASCVLLRQILSNPGSMYEVHASGVEGNGQSRGNGQEAAAASDVVDILC